MTYRDYYLFFIFKLLIKLMVETYIYEKYMDKIERKKDVALFLMYYCKSTRQGLI